MKRIKRINDKIYLVPENKDFNSTEVTEDMGFEVWGVVTQVIHSV